LPNGHRLSVIGWVELGELGELVEKGESGAIRVESG
jgi:hypothetical protein